MIKHKVIGLTGGVGCGKSSVAKKISEIYGNKVLFIFTDELAHVLMQPGGLTYKALIQEYGEGILEDESITDVLNSKCEQGLVTGLREISRPKLKQAVLDSKKGFPRLNELTHPIVKQETLRIIKEAKEELIVVEAALLIEAGMHKICDDVWYIFATEAERRERLIASRGYKDEYIDSLFANQLSEEEFRKNTTFVINNHNGQSDLETQIKSRVDQIKKKR